jgi:hypothetical protein
MIRGQSATDDSSSSSSANSRGVDEGTNDVNLGDDEDLPSAAAEAEENTNNINIDTNNIICKDAAEDDVSSISESSFNGYAAHANLGEEDGRIYMISNDCETRQHHDEQLWKQKL